MIWNVDTTAIAKLASLALGIVLGSVLYSVSHPAWLFQIDGRYLTLSQPRATQAISDYQRLFTQPDVEQFVLLGGSGAYHAINAEYVNAQLSRRLGRPVEAVLVAFESQSLLDTLAMIEALPPSKGAPRHVVFTWSFWRFFEPADDIIMNYQSFNRHLNINAATERFIASETFHDALNPPTGYASWQEFIDKKSLPGRRSILSTWIKYFIVDKLQKWQGGRLAYLFKDPPAFEGASALSDAAIESFLTAFARDEVQASVEKTVRRLLGQVKEAVAGQWRGEHFARLEVFSRLVFQQAAQAAEAKNFTLTFLELPIAPEAQSHPDISNQNWAIRSWLEGAVGADRMLAPQGDDELDRRESWWDLVHMSVFGARAYSDQLVEALAEVSGRQP